MLKGLVNGSLLLAGIGFLLIVMTTPNASSEIMSRMYQNFESHADNYDARNHIKSDGHKNQKG